jgi:hypothetical protein
MLFTERLYKETKDDHKNVDNHPFTKLIKLNKDAGDMYINFNKMCINAIQAQVNCLPISLQKKLDRNCESKWQRTCSDYELQLIKRCQEFPLEHSYLLNLGLILGGNLLKKYISKDHHSFLTFENSKELSLEFKTYLNNNVYIDYQDEFIENVKESYRLIKNIFDEYFLDF